MGGKTITPPQAAKWVSPSQSSSLSRSAPSSAAAWGPAQPRPLKHPPSRDSVAPSAPSSSPPSWPSVFLGSSSRSSYCVRDMMG